MGGETFTLAYEREEEKKAPILLRHRRGPLRLYFS